MNSRQGKKKSNVPTHWILEQFFESVSFVKHLYLICEAIGRLQERVLLCTPKPQVTEHWDQAVQTGSGQVPVNNCFRSKALTIKNKTAFCFHLYLSTSIFVDFVNIWEVFEDLQNRVGECCLQKNVLRYWTIDSAV